MLESLQAFSEDRRVAEFRLTGPARFRLDTVSPHDQDALAVFATDGNLHIELPNLFRGAVQSRRLAEEHRYAAREFISAARAAHEHGDMPAYRDHLDSARQARRRAYRCYQFARQCERRADAIAISSGFHPGF
jgi:hypothetical protein